MRLDLEVDHADGVPGLARGSRHELETHRLQAQEDPRVHETARMNREEPHCLLLLTAWSVAPALTSGDRPLPLDPGGGPAASASLVAPYRCLAVAAIHHVAVGVLHPLPAARAALATAHERTRHPARIHARLLAPVRGDPDGGIAALGLAGVDPSRVAPPRVLGRPGVAGEGEEKDDHEDRHLPDGLHAWTGSLAERWRLCP